MERRRRIPKVIWFPFGYRIEVKQKRLADASGYWIAGPKGGTIEIESRLPYLDRLETLGHEMAHAITDYRHWLNQEIILPLLQETVVEEEE